MVIGTEHACLSRIDAEKIYKGDVISIVLMKVLNIALRILYGRIHPNVMNPRSGVPEALTNITKIAIKRWTFVYSICVQ